MTTHHHPHHLHLAPGLDLPLQAVTERFAFIGQSESGKTYAAMRLAELMLEVGAQIVALDPLGQWWGLRAAADGKRPGFKVTVFGGIHGDVPITPDTGELVARIIVERGISAVVDVSDFTSSQMAKFISAFAEAFYNLKKRSPTPVHLYFEEAHMAAPQNLPPGAVDAAVMQGRVVRLIRVGRNFGIGTSQVTQAPQAVAKAALNQAGTIFAMRTIGKHERKAIREWFGDKATSSDELDLDELLMKQATGQAYVASPSFLKVSKQFHISQKVTFDSSKTPKFGEVVATPKQLADVDVAALKEAMKAAVAEAEANDPKKLHKKIAELEGELKKAQRGIHQAKPAAAPPARVERREVPVLKDGQLDRADGIADKALAAGSQFLEGAKLIADAIQSTRAPAPVAVPRPAPAPRADPAPRPIPRSVPAAASELSGNAVKLLEAMNRTHLPSLTRSQACTLANVSQSSSSTATAFGELREGHYVVQDASGRFAITDAGRDVVGGPPAKLQTHEEIMAMWLGSPQLSTSAKAFLQVLVASYPASLPRSEVVDRAGKSQSSSSTAAGLSELRNNGLMIDWPDRTLSAAAILFPDAAEASHG